MKNLFMKRVMVTALLASWCIQPVLAIDVSSWSDLRDAVQNSGTHTLTNNINSDGAIIIAADKVINIDGQGLYYADGLGTNELLVNYGNLTVDHITLQNGTTPINATAGAIRNYGNLTIGSDATLTANQSYQWGGAIHQESGSLNILSGAKFINNTANKNGANQGGYGGAVNIQSGTLTIADGTSAKHAVFDGNTAQKSGGAIFNDYNVYQDYPDTGLYGTAHTKTTVGNYTEFKNNKSQGGTGGGAIINQSILDIRDYVTFDNNSTTVNGGALAQQITGGVPAGKKGDIKTTVGNNVLFKNNTAGYYGGAIYNAGGKYEIGSNAQFGELGAGNVVSNGNTAQWGGGAVSNLSLTDTISFEDGAKFYGNKTLSAGPGLANGYPDGGGAVMNAGTMTFLSGAKFVGNESATYAGAIYNGGTMTIGGNTSFDSNTAASEGGAIYNSGTLTLDTTKGNITFTNNTANGAVNDIALSGTSSNKAVLNITGASNDVILNVITGNVDSIINKNTGNKLTLYGRNSAFLGEFNMSSGTTDVLAGVEFFGGTNNISGGTLNISGKLAGTNEITGGTVNMLHGSSKIAGTVTNIKGGMFNVNKRAELEGATNLAGGNMTINGGAILGGTIDFTNNNSTLALKTDSSNPLNLNSTITSGNDVGKITSNGGGVVNITSDQSGFKGSYTQNGGTTNVSGTGSSLFGGSSTVNNGGKVSLGSGSQIASGSTVTMNSGTTINAGDGSSIKGNVVLNGNSTLNTSGNVSIEKAITSDGTGSLISNTGHLTISGNQEGYMGKYEQRGDDAITELLNDSTFFGGQSDIYGGQFIFHETASLSSKEGASVNIKSEDVLLTIKGNNVVDGNKIHVNGGDFNLEKATLVDTVITGDSSFNTADSNVNMSSGSGFDNNANVTVENGANITLGDSSIAGKDTTTGDVGGDIAVNGSSNLNLNGSGLEYNLSSTGDGNINVSSDTADVTISGVSDNSNFEGKFNQTGGTVTVEDGAKFFGGDNTFTNSSVVNFESGSSLLGSNAVKDSAEMNINGGTVIGNDTTIALQGGSVNLIAGADNLDFSASVVSGSGVGEVSISGVGNVTISGDQSGFGGTLNHSAGNTTVSDKFFNGTNNITGGSITFDDGATLQGKNNITGGKVEISDTTVVNNTEVHFGDSSTGKLVINTDTDKEVKIDDSLKIDGSSGTIHKTGDGNLTLVGDQSSFTGHFQIGGTLPTTSGIALFALTSTSGGTVDVNDKFFGGTTELVDGTINFHEGSEIVAGSDIFFNGGGVVNIDGDTLVDGQFRSSVDSGTINFTDGTLTINGNQSGYTGKFTQEGENTETIITENGTFFGGDPTNDATKNEIKSGKITVEQGGKLATDVFVNRDVIITIKNDSGKTYIDSDGLYVNDDSAHFVGEFNIGGIDLVTKGTGVITQDVILSQDGRLALENDTLDTIQIGDGTSTNTITLSDGANTSYDKDMFYQVNNNATLQLAPTKNGTLNLNTAVTGTGDVLVDELVSLDGVGKGTGTVNINSDNSGFSGNYTQNSGNVVLTEGSKFFNGTNLIDGGSLTIAKGGILEGVSNSVTGGSVNLMDGAVLNNSITASKDTDSYGTVNLYNAIEGTINDTERPDTIIISSDDIANGNDGLLTYVNTEDGTTQSIIINDGAGLGLFNGVRIDGDLTLSDDKGVRDLTLGNGSGVEADNIILGSNTKLTYKDNAYIQEDSNLQIGSDASLNFANDKTSINYNPLISSIDDTAQINKSGNGSTAIVNTLENYHGSVNVTGGLLDLVTGEDKLLSGINVKDGALHIASNVGVENEAATDGKVNLSNGLLQVDKTLEINDELNVKDNSKLFVKENLGAGNTNISNSVMTVLKDFAADDVKITGNDSVVNLYGNSALDNLSIEDKSVLNAYGNVDISGGTLTVGAAGAAADTNNPTINMMGGSINSIIADNINLNSNANISFDVDPRSLATDTIIANNIITNGGSPDPYTLLVSGINFTQSPIDRNVTFNISNVLQDISGSQVDMVRLPDGGVISNSAMGKYLITSSGSSNMLNASLLQLNPQMYRGQVATVASYANQLVVNNILFDHMNILANDLIARDTNANRYAAANPLFAPYQYSKKDGDLWYKAYGNFERISMTQGLNVGNNAYGSLIGADFPLISLKNGWSIVPTAYIGYNGGHQTFDGVSMYQNGAQIGAMGTAYKGNFITSLLAYGGGYSNDMSVKGGFGSGSDTTGNWFAGVASKTAYNYHLPHDLILQPTALVSYNIFGNQNYHSNFGNMSMNSGFLNGINIAPGANLIWNKKTFSLYATAQLVFNIMGDVSGQAGNIDLNDVRMRTTYFEYGIGAMKRFKDTFSGYLQITLRNGYRTGIGFQGGLQWKIGKAPKK